MPLGSSLSKDFIEPPKMLIAHLVASKVRYGSLFESVYNFLKSENQLLNVRFISTKTASKEVPSAQSSCAVDVSPSRPNPTPTFIFVVLVVVFVIVVVLVVVAFVPHSTNPSGFHE